MRVIDIHVHHRWTAGQPSAGTDIDRMHRLAKKSGIEHILLLGAVTSYPLDPSPAQVHEANSYTIRLVRQYPDFFSGACYLNPAHDIEYMRQEILLAMQAGLLAIKLWAAVKAVDARLDSVMRLADEHNLPVFIHAWNKTTGNSPTESHSVDVANLARRFPTVSIVMAHLTGVHQRGVLDIADLANVWVDTSGGQPESGIVEYAVRHLGADRVVFGSDAPGRHFGTQVGRILGADIHDSAKEKILFGNANLLLHKRINGSAFR